MLETNYVLDLNKKIDESVYADSYFSITTSYKKCNLYTSVSRKLLYAEVENAPPLPLDC